MGNIFIDKMVKTCTKYREKEFEYLDKIAENNQKFSANYAEHENLATKQAQQQAYEEARASILNAYTELRTVLSMQSFPSVEQLTADTKILDSGMDFSASELMGYVERYQGNYTMLKFIKDWIAKHDEPISDQHTKYESVKMNIILPADKLDFYKKATEQALGVVEKIHENRAIMGRDHFTKTPVAPLEIDELSALSEYHANGVVGNGTDLLEFKQNKIPNTARHTFDNINPSEPTMQIRNNAGIGATAPTHLMHT